MSLPFLLEIGTEEIPDWMIVPALNNLQDMFQALLDQHVLGGMVTAVDATPRRLVLRAEGLLERQADVEEVVLGPSKSAGVGAAAGFAEEDGYDSRSVRDSKPPPRASITVSQNEPKDGPPRQFWPASCRI